MINIKNNLAVASKFIINYLVKADEDYELFDEMNNPLDRHKILRLIHTTYFIDLLPREIFKIIKAYYKSHRTIPKVREIIEKSELDFGDVESETIKTFFDINLNEYASDFIFPYLRAFVMVGQMNYSLINVNTKLKTEDIYVDDVMDIADYVMGQFSNFDLEFTDSSRGLDVSDPRSHIQIDISKKSTGFEYLDKVLGGWEPKTLVVFQGRPKVGKSLVLGNIAVRASQQGLNTAVVTVELGDRKYVKRLGSNLYDIPKHTYDMFTSDEDIPTISRLIQKKIDKNPGYGYLHVKEYPTDGVTVFDIEIYLQGIELHENIKFDLVVIDYINLIKSSRSDDNMYNKIKYIAQDLRKIAQRNKWTVVSATQIKREKYDAHDLDMGSGAESSALVATVDALFGLISPLAVATEMPIDGSEMTLKSHMIRIKNLANRDGGNMESWALFDKNMNHFRLTETLGAGTSFYPDEMYNVDGTPKKIAERMEITHNANRMGDIVVNPTHITSQQIDSPNPNAGMPNKQQVSYEEIQTSFNNSPAFTSTEDVVKPNIRMDENTYERKEGIHYTTNEILENNNL